MSKHFGEYTLSEGYEEAKRAPLHVLIIGAGIGGLCLAQGLKKAGISVAVYERDASVHFRSQGYRISIKDDGSQGLRDCLPEHLFQLCVATSIRTATLMVVLDEQLRQRFAIPLQHPSIPDDTRFGVHRLTLREILLGELEGIVHFDKQCKGFEQVEHGQVRVSFADGTTASGDLLVGADGTGSVVRAQLVPDASIDTLHYAIWGKTPIQPDTLAWVPEVLIDSFNRVAGPQSISMSIATCRKWQVFAEATSRFAPTLQLTDVPDYFSWMLSLTDEVFYRADASRLHQRACDIVKEWHPVLRRMIDEADVSATFPIAIHTARPVAPWHMPNVTLLGDAIHTMSPGRGEGANTALRDARLLRQALISVETLGVPLAQAKAAYETEMLRYGFEAVANALKQPFQPRFSSDTVA